jgi:hypothetical protein
MSENIQSIVIYAPVLGSRSSAFKDYVELIAKLRITSDRDPRASCFAAATNIVISNEM